jgi:DNA-binding PadR family transcriptional regulator
VKPREVLFPSAFTVAAILCKLGNTATVGVINETAVRYDSLLSPNPHSCWQILKHMEENGYAARHKEPGQRTVWRLTESGVDMLERSRRFYAYAVKFME